MRKKWKHGLVYLGMAAMLVGCGQNTKEAAVFETQVAQESEKEAESSVSDGQENDVDSSEKAGEAMEGAVNIALSDDGILVDGADISKNQEDAVYAAKDIVYYEAGKDFTYGEGTEEDEHTKEEADAHTVVHITKPGTYAVSGKISAGQIAVDLGEDAEEDPEAVVTLILNGAEINCSVAPGVIFYRVYECGEADPETASKDVDTSAAGANVVIADGTENFVNGSYVARIYKSVELNEEGTEVIDSKKLHKYDAAFYSKMTMNVNGGEEGTGVLNIKAENEGLDSELHLTINGGNINIVSGNDGINTNEDYVSVTTVNDGMLKIQVDGATGEGDGIDSNGWLVINGGTVIAEACSFSGDAGIDSDMGIHINGGTVIATGNMLDHISESEQPFAVFTFAESQKGGASYTVKDTEGKEILSCTPENAFSYLIMSDAGMGVGEYTLWMDDVQLAGAESDGRTGGFGGGMPGGRPGMPEGKLPEDFDPENMPEGMTSPELPEDFDPENMPEEMTPPEMPEDFDPENIPENNGGQRLQGSGRPGGSRGNRGELKDEEKSELFSIKEGGSYFGQVAEK